MISAHFGQVGLVGRATFTLRQGIAPSTGSIAFPIGTNMPTNADLVLSDGDNNVRIPNLFLVDPVVVESEAGPIVEATIADIRWTWKYGYISGKYNQPDDYGLPRQEYNLQVLLNSCLSVYGETAAYVSVPTNLYPAVDWDFDNPGEAIQTLCDQHGLSLSIGLDGNVYIAPTTEPRTDIEQVGGEMSREVTFQTPDIPASVKIVGNPIVNQETFTLKAVGIEDPLHGSLPNKVREIDNLSYKPAGGWSLSYHNDFNDIADADLRSLAKKCVFKWYAWIPTNTGYDTRKHKLPWLNHISKFGEIDTPSGTEYARKDPEVWSNAAIVEDGIVINNPSLAGEQEDFAIDYNLGIVKFKDPRFRMASGTNELAAGAIIPPTLMEIDAAYEKHEGAGADNYMYTHALGGNYEPFVYRDPALTEYQIAGTPTAEKTALDTHAALIATQLAKQFENQLPRQWVLAGIWPIVVYGELKSITWSVGEGGAVTTFSKGIEEIRPFLPTYTERILQKKSKALQWPIEHRVAQTRQRRKHV